MATEKWQKCCRNAEWDKFGAHFRVSFWGQQLWRALGTAKPLAVAVVWP